MLSSISGPTEWLVSLTVRLRHPMMTSTLLAQFTKSRISVWSSRVLLALKKLQLQYKVRLLMLNETSKMKAWIWKYIYWVYPVPNSVLNSFLTRQTSTILRNGKLQGCWMDDDDTHRVGCRKPTPLCLLAVRVRVGSCLTYGYYCVTILYILWHWRDTHSCTHRT